MGGGVIMRAAAKVAGIGALHGSLRGGESTVVSAARQASRSVASVVSSSDDLKLAIANDNNSNTNSSVDNKPYDDWEFAGVEDELFVEAGEPMPRLVFGGAPTIQEAKQATYELNDVLEKTYLVSETSAAPLVSNHAMQAFRFLNQSSTAQNVVASIASDPNVWNAVLQNEALVDFLETHKTSVVFPETDPNINDPLDKNQQESGSESGSGKGFMGYFDDFKQKISVTVVDMMNKLSDTFESLFGGSSKGEVVINPDGTAGISVEKAAIGASLMGLAIMVVMVVVFKRA